MLSEPDPDEAVNHADHPSINGHTALSSAVCLDPGTEFCLTTQRLPGGGGGTPPPWDRDFIVGKSEILQKEILIWLFLVHKLLDFWVPGPPPPSLKENSARALQLMDRSWPQSVQPHARLPLPARCCPCQC